MKIYLDDNSSYIEIKKNKTESVDLSIRVSKEDKTSLIITANLNIETIDNIIATLIAFKAESKNV